MLQRNGLVVLLLARYLRVRRRLLLRTKLSMPELQSDEPNIQGGLLHLQQQFLGLCMALRFCKQLRLLFRFAVLLRWIRAEPIP